MLRSGYAGGAEEQVCVHDWDVRVCSRWCVCVRAHDNLAAYRYVILNKDFEKAYKATIKKTTDELEFYK